MILKDYFGRYESAPISESFIRLYQGDVGAVVNMFASFHQRLNGHLEFMNQKANLGGHFNAADSRDLLGLMTEVEQAQKAFRRAGFSFDWLEPYKKIIERCKGFLVYSVGSPIPDGLCPIEVEEWAPVLALSDSQIVKSDKKATFPLVLVGEGSYAFVHKYVDTDYGLQIARKKAKPNISATDLARFKREYDLLRGLSFPYLVQVYAYNEADNSYTMEYCDSTLGSHFAQNNHRMAWGTRKRIALQLLYGLNYIHRKGLLHRDLSRANVLVRRYEYGAVIVKLADFGLVKDSREPVTNAETSMKGSIRDPTLGAFGDYDQLAEVYSVGVMLSFIFSGQDGLGVCTGRVQQIVAKCTDNDRRARYQSVREVTADVEALADETSVADAETPA